MDSQADVVVIGAGPAGMAAATSAAAVGAEVILLDEQPGPGGQIYRAIETVIRDRPADISFLGKAYGHGEAVVGAFRAVACDYRPHSTVWHIGENIKGRQREIIYSQKGESRRILTKYVVIATGALERPVPIPGWTIPGVMTAGAVQSALKTSGAYPRGQLILMGSGPLILQLAVQLIAANVPISAIVDTTPPGGFGRALFNMPRAFLAGQYLLEGLRFMRVVKRSNVPIYKGAVQLEVNGDETVRNISFYIGGQRFLIDCDVVALHEGVIPNTQLTRLLGVEHRWNFQQRCFHPVIDQWGETTDSGVYVVGDGGAIGGALAAELDGHIVGLTVSERLGLLSESARDLIVEEQRLRGFINRSIRPFLDDFYPAPDWIGGIKDEVLACRCEEITAGQIRSVVRMGCSGPNHAKAFLRCGMGPCQGRMCASTVTDIIAKENGKEPFEVGSFRIRPPIKPITLRELANLNYD